MIIICWLVVVGVVTVVAVAATVVDLDALLLLSSSRTWCPVFFDHMKWPW